MILSMTAFASQSAKAQWGTLTWELRTVNHRFLEISLRLPEALRSLEQTIREEVQRHIGRGKVDGYLKFHPGEEIPFEVSVNKQLAQQLGVSCHEVGAFFPTQQVNLIDVLSWPGILQTQPGDMQAVEQAALQLLQDTLQGIVAARRREGQSLHDFIDERLTAIQQEIRKIQQRLPEVLNELREKIKMRFDELSVALDQERLEQEMVWLMQKLDIAEELQRLSGHVVEVQRVLAKETRVGRRLDFLLQEMNREANTLSSKANDLVVTQAGVELKVLLEQIREQVQNIE